MNSTVVGQKRSKGGTESPNENFDGSDKSYSPGRADLQPSNNPNTRFTTTVMGPFRTKGGYSAPQQKRDINGYVDIPKGPFFSNPRSGTAISEIEKRSTSNTIKNKANLPNVSMQRVQIKSSNERNYQGSPAYPNSVAGININRSHNSSIKRRDIQFANPSFQIANNNFIQTSYGSMGGMNQAQLLNNVMVSNNTSRANKKYKINNFNMANSNMNTIYLKKYNKNLFNIYKSKQQQQQQQPNRQLDSRSNSPRTKSTNPKINIPTHQIFGKQFGSIISRGSGSQQRKQNIISTRANYSPRAGSELQEYPGIMNNTMTGGFINNSFNIGGGKRVNVVNGTNRPYLKNSRY